MFQRMRYVVLTFNDFAMKECLWVEANESVHVRIRTKSKLVNVLRLRARDQRVFRKLRQEVRT